MRRRGKELERFKASHFERSGTHVGKVRSVPPERGFRGFLLLSRVRRRAFLGDGFSCEMSGFFIISGGVMSDWRIEGFGENSLCWWGGGGRIAEEQVFMLVFFWYDSLGNKGRGVF